MARTHAYIGIKDGQCQAATVDTGDARVAHDVAKFIRQGCVVECVTIEVARTALFEPWPLIKAVEG